MSICSNTRASKVIKFSAPFGWYELVDQLFSSSLLSLTTGMILLSELSRRRIRSINKLIRVGRSECVVVIRVDKEKGYIDLSKRRVSPEDIVKCEEKFAKAKAVREF